MSLQLTFFNCSKPCKRPVSFFTLAKWRGQVRPPTV